MKLEQLFLSKARGRLFRLLFGLERSPAHVRDLERRADLTYSAVRQELRRLESLGLITSRRDGNRLYYAADEAHPLFAELHGLVLKTDGLVSLLRAALGTKGIQVALVFGSIARGTDHALSDVDLLVVGAVGLRDVASRLQHLDDELSRPVNAITRSPDELRAALASNDPFLADVVSGPKLFVVGSQHDLDAVAGQRLARQEPPGTRLILRRP